MNFVFLVLHLTHKYCKTIMNKKLITGLALLVNGFLSAQVNLSQSLTACYTLDGNGTEPINNLTATLSAVTPTVDRFNNPSSAIAFNGSALSYIELPDNPLLKPTNAFSFSGWIKTSDSVDQYILMTKNPAFSNFESYDLHLGNSAGALRIRAKKGDGSGNSSIITGTNTINTNTWYHFALTIDNNNLNLYTNGSLVASAPTTFAFSYQANKNIILGGSNEPNFDLPFTGSMDNLRFYNRILSASEINQLYLTDPTCIVSSVASFSDSKIELKIFPNPSAGKFTVNTDEEVEEMEVHDILGKSILKTNNNTEINLSDEPEGVYFIKLKINGQIITRKIIKD